MQKRIRKRIISFITVFVVAWMSASPVMGAMKVIPISIDQQHPDEKCCWAYVGVSACRYYGKTVSLDDFIFRLIGSYDHYTPQTLYATSTGMSMFGVPNSYHLSTLSGGLLTDGIINTQISENDPIPCGGSTYSDEYGGPFDHAYLVVGFDPSISNTKENTRIKDSMFSNSLRPASSYKLRAYDVHSANKNFPYLVYQYIIV